MVCGSVVRCSPDSMGEQRHDRSVGTRGSVRRAVPDRSGGDVAMTTTRRDARAGLEVFEALCKQYGVNMTPVTMLDNAITAMEERIKELEETLGAILDDYDGRMATKHGRFQVWLARVTSPRKK